MKFVMRLGALVGLFCAARTLSACYASAHAARENQTLAADNWTCYSDPVVECPNRPDGRCTGWDQRWISTCPDNGSRWVCRFASEGVTFAETMLRTRRARDSRIHCNRLEPAQQFAHAAPPPQPTAPSGVRAQPGRDEVATVLAAVQRRAEGCLPLGVFQMRLVYANDGGVVRVDGAEGVPESATACVLQHARELPMQPFARTQFTVSYPFSHQ